MFFNKDSNDGRVTGAQARALPMLPLRDVVIFPHMVFPLIVGREKSVAALEEAMSKDKDIILATQKKAKTNEPTEEEIHSVGTLASILQLLRMADGTVKVIVEGKSRAIINKYVPNRNFFIVEVEEVTEDKNITVETEALMRSVISSFETLVKLNPKIPPEMLLSVSGIDGPGRLADTIAAHLNLKLEDRQVILATLNPNERLEKIYTHMQGELEILQIERRIKARVKKQMEKTQKEYYLNEQMRAIQKELGDKDDYKSEIQEIEEKLKDKKLSAEAQNKVKAEIKKMKMMMPMSAEATVSRNYIDWIISLPWDEKSEDKLEISDSEKILDEDHYGLKQVKERIVEYLAVRRLVGKMKGPILCFVGPPGVGKTSLGKSIARAMGRKFVRVSLGGVRDEAEIRGHRRTYIGALPGKIIQYMKRAGSSNPVFLLDEVDKMSMDFRGDPASALLEVLDPEQNYTFNDHYLDLDYDLSDVMFITTANTLPPIPPALQDRMEIIRLSGYTEMEKLQIARRFLIKKQVEAHGLKIENITFTKQAVLKLIRHYTKEAGVRNLEREIANLCRKVAKRIAKGGSQPVKLTSAKIERLIGVPKFHMQKGQDEDKVGVATGLAWTEMGGELLVTEVTVVPGKGKLIITGKLGDVMKESAQAAMSYVRSRSRELGLDEDFYQKIDIHIHVPEGAIPKDGPSAGITIATAITSAVTRIPTRSDVAMTGEITLRGNILPIGGLKEKILAAHRGGRKTVIVPRDNEKDLKEIQKKVLKDLEIVLVENMDQVLLGALKVDSPEKLWRKKEEAEKFISGPVPSDMTKH
jgi:ATP-dependent Lon protease